MSDKPNLHQRIVAIMEDAGAIEKEGKAHPSIGGFAYHAIDDVDGAIRPLLVRHGVTVVPDITERERVDVTVSGGKVHNRVTIHLDVTFCNADNPADKLTLRAVGMGVDPSDKAEGKAVSYALKTLYLAVFHLRGKPDNEADVPAERLPPKPKQKPSTAEAAEPDLPNSYKDVIGEIKSCPTSADVDIVLAAAKADIVRKEKTMTKDQMENVKQFAEARRAVIKAEAQANADDPGEEHAP